MSLFFSLILAALGLFSCEALRMPQNVIPWRLTTVNGFSWANCDAESLPGKIKSLTLHPDPITIPGDVSIATVLSTNVPVESPLKIAITAEKELFGEWVKVPCLDNLGSCTYDDACSILDALIQPGQECPEPLRTYDLPCHCPFKKGSYSLPDTSIKIPNLSLPSWLASGNYRVTGVMSHENEEIGCAKFTFSLESSDSSWW
ncbi:ganglioside GM2 activator-like [Pelobates cultripes]|uniref:Ganglioside GM2 activator-like n=1 Tax=Pelobates cultripes TaxID=61616 RepID=A0AAD1RS30_PELCU|nr:ganglioside GM2 activator-like [Pelobates cultripes]